MTTPRPLALAALVALALGACDVVIGIPDRKLGLHLSCDADRCVCTDGHGDCDGDPSNGCEDDLTSAKHCGACGHVCENGTCEAGLCACKPGFVDCDGDAANGCEAELAADPGNCGTCGHDCLGGLCGEGRCKAVEMHTFTEAFSLAVAGEHLLVALCGDTIPSPLVRLPVDGGAPSALALDPGCGVHQTASGGMAYFRGEDSIFRTPIAAPAQQELVVTVPHANAVVAGASHLYFTTYDDGTKQGAFHRMALPAGTPEKILDVRPEGFFATAEHIYWSDAKGVHVQPHTGGAVTDLPGFEAPSTLFVHQSTLYVAEWGATAPGIVALPLAGGPPALVVPGAAPFAMFVDDDGIHWADGGDANVYSVPLSGGPKVTLAEGYGMDTFNLVADARAVYWLTSYTTVYKRAK